MSMDQLPDWWWITLDPATMLILVLDLLLTGLFIQRRRQQKPYGTQDSMWLALQFMVLWSVAGMVARHWY